MYNGGENWRGQYGQRGRGYRGRGKRHGHRQDRRQWQDDEHGSSADSDNRGYGHDRGRGSRRGGRPPGLRGKDIGLWFAKKSKEKKIQEEYNNREVVQMDHQKERHLSNLLHTIRTADNVPPQPSRSYQNPGRDWFDSDEDSEVHPKSHIDAVSQSERPELKNQTDNFSVSDSFYHADGAAASTSHDPYNHMTSSSLERNDHKYQEPASKFSVCSDSQDGRVNAFNNDNCSDESEDEERGDGEEDAGLWQRETEEDNFYNEEDWYDEEIINMDNLLKYRKEEDDFELEYQRHKEANKRSMEYLPGITYVKCSLKRNQDLDEELKRELLDKQNNHKYQSMMKFRKKLPSYEMREKIVKLVNENRVTVISGETGCGKTTQVAQFILDDHIMRGAGSVCRVVCTQPRRISAISVAERVADERAETCGSYNSVGYQIRLDVKPSREEGSILYCTNGILLQWLRGDQYLTKVSHIILDEIHERDLHSDFLMIILKDLLSVRQDLKIILMSATLNAEMFSQYYGNCPMINIPGFTYPVKECLLEDVLEELHYRPPIDERRKRRMSKKEKMEAIQEEEDYLLWLASIHKRYSQFTMDTLRQLKTTEMDFELISRLVEHIVRTKEDGAILIFMPGWEDIKKVYELLKARPLFNPAVFRILPLHSMMPTINQREVFQQPPPGVRKIVIATNIAETSITIDDIVHVIDCGKIKLKKFDPEHNISTLKPEWVAKANSKQRRGRAGRVQPGYCYHMYTGFQEQKLADYQLPEMLRTRLEELCLQIKLLKLGKIKPFIEKAMEKPSLQSLECAVNCLVDLNALDKDENLTALGYHLAKMPVDPHSGKMLLFGAMFSCLEPILTVAASLSFKDAFVIPLGKEAEADRKRRELADGCQSDHVMLAKAYQGWEKAESRSTGSLYCWKNFMSASTLKMLSNMRRQFAELLFEMGFVGSPDPRARSSNINSSNERLIKGVICAGLYPNVAKMTNQNKRLNKLSTKTDRSVQVHPKSVNEREKCFDSRWMVYHLKMKTAKVYLYDTTCVSTYPLLFFGGNLSIKQDRGQECITVDDWIVFRSPSRIANIVQELRKELDKLLEYKITHPGPTDWYPKCKEGALMRAITDLITTEEAHPAKSQNDDRRH